MHFISRFTDLPGIRDGAIDWDHPLDRSFGVWRPRLIAILVIAAAILLLAVMRVSGQSRAAPHGDGASFPPAEWSATPPAWVD